MRLKDSVLVGCCIAAVACAVERCPFAVGEVVGSLVGDLFAVSAVVGVYVVSSRVVVVSVVARAVVAGVAAVCMS